MTLEELLGGKTLARIEEGGDVADGVTDADAWVKTRYIQDVTQAYAQVLVEIGEESRTAYAYGLERISGEHTTVDGTLKTQYGYVYDGRGSVAQVVGDGAVTSMEYTAFGEMIGDGVAVSGYGYNGEQYDAATGMIHLRARQYEPAMNRFSQKDVLRGSIEQPLSLNRYAFVVNDPVNYADPSGLVPSAAIAAAEAAKSSKATSKGYADTGGYENQTKPSTVSAKNATTVDYPVNSSAGYAYSGPTTTTTTPPSNSTYTFLPATQRYGTTNSSSPLTGLVKSSNEVKKKAAEAYLTQQAQNAVTEAQRNAYQAAAAEVKNLNPNKAADLVKINQIVQAACSGELGKKKAEDATQILTVDDFLRDGFYKIAAAIAFPIPLPTPAVWSGTEQDGKTETKYLDLEEWLAEWGDPIYDAMRSTPYYDPLSFMNDPLALFTLQMAAVMGYPSAVDNGLYHQQSAFGKWLVDSIEASQSEWRTERAIDAISAALVNSIKNGTNTELLKALLFAQGNGAGSGAAGGSASGSSSSGGDNTPTPNPSKATPTPTPTATVKEFSSSDKYVGETANAIEQRYPAKVVDVNKIVRDSSGRIVTDYDIELDDCVIQVKSGTAKGLTTQMKNTASSTDKRVIGFTPDLNPSSAVVKGVKEAGFEIFTSLEELLDYLGR